MTDRDERKRATAADSESRIEISAEMAATLATVDDPEARRKLHEAWEQVAAGWYRQVHGRNAALDRAEPLAASEIARLDHSAETRRDRGQHYLELYERTLRLQRAAGLTETEAARRAREIVLQLYRHQTGHKATTDASFKTQLCRWRKARRELKSSQ